MSRSGAGSFQSRLLSDLRSLAVQATNRADVSAAAAAAITLVSAVSDERDDALADRLRDDSSAAAEDVAAAPFLAAISASDVRVTLSAVSSLQQMISHAAVANVHAVLEAMLQVLLQCC